jgi:hypothetical protein
MYICRRGSEGGLGWGSRGLDVIPKENDEGHSLPVSFVVCNELQLNCSQKSDLDYAEEGLEGLERDSRRTRCDFQEEHRAIELIDG